jgi:two-component system, OmpR family, phosphate regulon sensor histidine kinase PhoR
MTPPIVPPLRLVLATAVLVVAAMLGAATAAIFGILGAVVAALGALAAIAAGLAVLNFHRDDLTAVARYVERLSEAEEDQPTPPTPERCSTGARAVIVAVARLNRLWRRRLQRLEALIEADEQILEALHDPLVLIGADRQVVRANQAARGLFGERIVERDLAAVLRNPHVLSAVDAVLGGGGSRNLEFSLPVPVERVFEARIMPFRRGDGGEGDERDTTVILTLHDITAIKRSEQMRADFVANASHELRTPLSSLLGFIETLRGPARDDPEAQERFLAIMNDQARRMSRLVSDLLSLSRIELDEHTQPTGPADLGVVLRTVIAGLELKAQGRRIHIRLEAPGEIPPVTGDEDQLSQVFQNLIDNAVKYGRERTEVTVTVSRGEGWVASGALSNVPVLPASVLRRPQGMVAVAVTDRGEGIARTHLPRLTERFYRVDAARSKALGGTGLGLAIVKHIVNRHRGRLTIESEVGKGSTFTVLLPTAEARPADQAPERGTGQDNARRSTPGAA